MRWCPTPTSRPGVYRGDADGHRRFRHRASDTAVDTARVAVNAPPVARAGADQIVTASEVRFDGSGSQDPDGEIVRYAWDFGDGTAGEGATSAHVYRKPGSYDVTLTVTDNSGTPRNSAARHLRVLVNQAPIADAGPDLLGVARPGVRVLGLGLVRPGRRPRRLSLGLQGRHDGQRRAGDAPLRAAGRLPGPADGARRYRPAGRGRFRRCGGGGQRAAGRQRRCRPADGTGRSRRVRRPQLVRSATAASRASAGTSATSPSLHWVARSRGPTTRPGIYSARLTVTDGSGAVNGVAQDQVTIRVNHAPVANAGADVVTAGSTVDLRRRRLGRRRRRRAGLQLGLRRRLAAGRRRARQPHLSTPAGGTYPVVLTVDDGTGQRNAKAVAAITVTIDGPPVADAGGNREVCAGDVVVLDGSRSRDAEGGLLRYRWDFGDGSGADIVNPTKTYDRGGTYPVTLTVEDDSGFPTNRHTDRAAGAGDRIADRGGRARPDGLRQHRSPLRRFRLARRRRRGQPVRLGLRRRHHRRRRPARPHLRQARRLPGRAHHRGRPGGPMRQHQLERADRAGRRGAGTPDRSTGQRRRRRERDVRRIGLDGRLRPHRGLGLGFRRRRLGRGLDRAARLREPRVPTSSP